MPNFLKVGRALQGLRNKYRTTDGLDLDAELATLQASLQGIFDEVAP